jgi:hypothetical protein
VTSKSNANTLREISTVESLGKGSNLLVKISVNRYIQRRIAETRQEMETVLKKLRRKMLKNFEEIFEMAGKIAKGEVKHQRVDGKMTKITIPQRKRWLLVAGQTAEIIKGMTENFNEKEIKTKLEKLENLLKSVTAT